MINGKGKLRDIISRYALQIILIGFTLFGLGCKIVISLSKNLTSDDVNPGIMAMEIWKHSDYLLYNFYLPANCTHIFTEVVPLYLISQILTNFSPVAYRCIGFVLFVLIILVFSYIIYLMTNSRVKSLVFAAIFANLTPVSYISYSAPVTHNGVILFAGLLLLIVLTRRIGYYVKLVLFTAILSLIILSDTTIILWFVIPFVVYYVLFYHKKDLRSNLSMILACGIGVIVFAIKMLLIDYYILDASHFQSLTAIINVNIPLYVNGLIMLYNGNLYQSLNGFSSIGVLDVLFIAITLLLAYLVYRDHTRTIDGKMLMVYTVLFTSAVVMMIAYVASGYARDISTTRYLIFTGLFIFILIAVAFNEKSKLYVYAIVVFLALLAISNISYIATLDSQPNKAEYGLIDLLQANDLHYGYGNYWTANVITYLSNENVTIRQLNFNDSIYKLNDTSRLVPYLWFSGESWYTYQPDEYFVIIDKNQSIQPEFIEGYIKTHDVYEKLEYENYDIYVFHSKPDIFIIYPKSHISLALQEVNSTFSKVARAV